MEEEAVREVGLGLRRPEWGVARNRGSHLTCRPRLATTVLNKLKHIADRSLTTHNIVVNDFQFVGRAGLIFLGKVREF